MLVPILSWLAFVVMVCRRLLGTIIVVPVESVVIVLVVFNISIVIVVATIVVVILIFPFVDNMVIIPAPCNRRTWTVAVAVMHIAITEQTERSYPGGWMRIADNANGISQTRLVRSGVLMLILLLLLLLLLSIIAVVLIFIPVIIVLMLVLVLVVVLIIIMPGSITAQQQHEADSRRHASQHRKARNDADAPATK